MVPAAPLASCPTLRPPASASARPPGVAVHQRRALAVPARCARDRLKAHTTPSFSPRRSALALSISIAVEVGLLGRPIPSGPEVGVRRHVHQVAGAGASAARLLGVGQGPAAEPSTRWRGCRSGSRRCRRAPAAARLRARSMARGSAVSVGGGRDHPGVGGEHGDLVVVRVGPRQSVHRAGEGVVARPLPPPLRSAAAGRRSAPAPLPAAVGEMAALSRQGGEFLLVGAVDRDS